MPGQKHTQIRSVGYSHKHLTDADGREMIRAAGSADDLSIALQMVLSLEGVEYEKGWERLGLKFASLSCALVRPGDPTLLRYQGMSRELNVRRFRHAHNNPLPVVGDQT